MICCFAECYQTKLLQLLQRYSDECNNSLTMQANFHVSIWVCTTYQLQFHGFTSWNEQADCF